MTVGRIGSMCVVAAALLSVGIFAQDPPASSSTPAAAPLSAAQLQSLVAPVALYPDPLLTQVLVAATYPLDVMEAEQWLAQNSSLTGDALSQASMKQPWDPSVQSLTAFPTVLKQMASNVSWTTNLGNAFLAQKDDLMAAVQTLRQQAQASGKLQSNDQQTVTTQTTDSKPYVVIQPASTQVVYVPTYSPAVIWGPPLIPYLPIWYPPPAYGAGFAVGFAAGVHFGAWFGGGWGWGCGWGGHTTIIINNNNTYIHNHNTTNNYNRSGNSEWHHNPGQRGNVPYRPDGPHTVPARPTSGGGANPGGRDRPVLPGQTRDGDAARNAEAQNRGRQMGGAGQQDRRPEGRVGNRDVSPQRRQGAWGSGGQRQRMVSSRGHQSMGHPGGGARGGGGGGGRRR